MANILVCVPSTREYKPFLESFDKFIIECRKNHTIVTFIVKDKRLKDVQNEAAQKFMSGNFDYLLFMDDDHWGHTPEMLECLINANAYMATIKSYSRHYPYFSCLMNRIPDSTFFSGIDYAQGYVEVDMTGFSMTLLRRDLLQKIGVPYFEEEHEGGRDWVTDTIFCRKLNSMGIKPVGCFQHCLPHFDITDENVLQRRTEGGNNWNGMILNMAYDKLMESGKLKGEKLCTAHQ